MCSPSGAVPTSARHALAALHGALSYLALADPAQLTAAEQADCLRGLQRAESMRVAAQSSVLAAFEAGREYAADGHGTARSWLRWQARISGPAASAAIGWARRLASHPAVGAALAAGRVSESWARHICDWTDLLPVSARGDADTILLAAAAAGATLNDLAGLAEEMRARTAPPDSNDPGDPGSRTLRLDLHYRGAGRLRGDLTPRCAAAVQAVLDALGKKQGREDIRTQAQRDHDALEEACRRLIAAGMLPDTAGQPAKIQLHADLTDLLNRAAEHGGQTDAGDSAGHAGSAGTGRNGTRDHRAAQDRATIARRRLYPGQDVLTGPRPGGYSGPGPLARPGDLCDASIVPVVTGHVDHDFLAQLAEALITGTTGPLTTPCRPGPIEATAAGQALGEHAARDLILRGAIALLSGPGGLASRLRTGTLTGPAASISLPLDVGTSTDTIPPHLRRAVWLRDQGHCGFPGCENTHCQVHHVIPRSEGGATRLADLVLGCTFHHLIAIHEWGWTLTVNPDGTKTATSPDGQRTLHSHSPPLAA